MASVRISGLSSLCSRPGLGPWQRCCQQQPQSQSYDKAKINFKSLGWAEIQTPQCGDLQANHFHAMPPTIRSDTWHKKLNVSLCFCIAFQGRLS